MHEDHSTPVARCRAGLCVRGIFENGHLVGQDLANINLCKVLWDQPGVLPENAPPFRASNTEAFQASAYAGIRKGQ